MTNRGFIYLLALFVDFGLLVCHSSHGDDFILGFYGVELIYPSEIIFNFFRVVLICLAYVLVNRFLYEVKR